MQITFHGQSCFVIQDGLYSVVIDPFLSGNPLAVAKPADIKVNAVLLTHGHGDHTADAEEIAKANDAPIIAPDELAWHFEVKGCKTHSMHLGGKRTFEFGTVKLTLAFHGSGLDTPEGVRNAGHPCGFLVTMGGKTVYHAGDTALFGDMKLIGEMNHVDVALLPIGDNYTMGPEDALYAAEWVHAGLTVPMHYNTFDVIRQDPHAFVAELAKRGLKGQVMDPGEILEL